MHSSSAELLANEKPIVNRPRSSTQLGNGSGSNAHKERKISILSWVSRNITNFFSPHTSSNSRRRQSTNRVQTRDRRSCSVGNLAESEENPATSHGGNKMDSQHTDQSNGNERESGTKWHVTVESRKKSEMPLAPLRASKSLDNLFDDDKATTKREPNEQAAPLKEQKEEDETKPVQTITKAPPPRPLVSPPSMQAELSAKLGRLKVTQDDDGETSQVTQSTHKSKTSIPEGGFRLPQPGMPFNPFAPPGARKPFDKKKPDYDPTGNDLTKDSLDALDFSVPLARKSSEEDREDLNIAKMRISALADRRGARESKIRPMTMMVSKSRRGPSLIDSKTDLSNEEAKKEEDEASLLIAKLIGSSEVEQNISPKSLPPPSREKPKKDSKNPLRLFFSKDKKNSKMEKKAKPVHTKAQDSIVEEEPIQEAIPVKVKDVNKSSLVKVEDTDKSSPVKMEDVDKSSPVKMEDVDKSSPVKIEDTDKSSPVKVEDTDKSSPVKVEDTDKSSPVKVEDTDKSSPVKMEDTDKSSPVKMENTDKSSPVKMEDVDKSSPVKVEDTDKSSPVKIEDTDKSSPVKVEVTDKSSPMKVEDTDKSSPVKIEDTDKSSPVKVDDTDKSSPVKVEDTIVLPSSAPLCDHSNEEIMAEKLETDKNNYVISLSSSEPLNKTQIQIPLSNLTTKEEKEQIEIDNKASDNAVTHPMENSQEDEQKVEESFTKQHETDSGDVQQILENTEIPSMTEEECSEPLNIVNKNTVVST